MTEFRHKLLTIIASAFFISVTGTVDAAEWGIGVSFQQSTIPYQNNLSKRVGNTVPNIYYEDDSLFARGEEWGIKVVDNNQWAISPIAKRRWVNIPRALQNEFQLDAVDLGIQALWKTSDNQQWRIEVLTAKDWRSYIYAGHDWQFQIDQIELNTKAGLRFKSDKYNSYYYGLNEFDGENINPGTEAVLAMDFRYPLTGNLYLTGGLEWTQLDKNARHSAAVDKNGFGTAKLGIAFFEQGNALGTSIPEGSYIRVAYGWATPSDMGEILTLNGEKDSHNHQMTSVFYGHLLQEGWLLEPVDVYLTGGLTYHPSSSVQSISWEPIVAIKAYYNFTSPVRWRLGLAEGMSYISRVTYIEASELNEKGYRESKLMNALDISLDVNLGDLTNIPELKTAWLGYGLQHRSAIFEHASHFGRIKGGSNYNTIYLQWHY